MSIQIFSSAQGSLGQNSQVLAWKWWQNFTFKIIIPTLNAPASTNKAFIFKLTIEDYSKIKSFTS